MWYFLGLALLFGAPFVTRTLRFKPLLIWGAILLLVYFGMFNIPQGAFGDDSGMAASWLVYYMTLAWGAFFNLVIIIRQAIKLAGRGYR